MGSGGSLPVADLLHAHAVGVSVSAPAEDQEDIILNPGGTRCEPTSIGMELLSKDGGLTRDAGTSVSAALVAGVAALMEEQATALGTVLTIASVRLKIRATPNRKGEVPLDSTHLSYTFDGEREGIAWAPGALQ